MIFSLISFAIALFISLGRQITVFLKVKSGLWFFSHFEKKRFVASMLSLTLALIGFSLRQMDIATVLIGLGSLLLIGFSYFFDMRNFFPTITIVGKKQIKKQKNGAENRVLGIVMNDEIVAYPFETMLVPRHIVNDVLGNVPVFISYCALCRSALAFDPVVDGTRLTFRVTGVWRRNMLVTDQLTGSVWQQATGECIYGPLKGKKLPMVSTENTTYSSWLKKHPHSSIASISAETKGYLSVKNMNNLIELATSHITVPGFTKLTDLNKREVVFGIEHNGVAKAYPLKKLHKQDKSKFDDMVNDRLVSFVFNKEAESLEAVDKETGAALLVERHWWTGWKEFHPETIIW